MFKTKDIISKITIIIGLIVIFYSAFLYLSELQPYENQSITEGVIVDYYKSNDKNYPIIQYFVNNDTFLLESKEPLHTFAKENRVTLKYRTDNPNESVIYESYLFYGIPISIATIGIMILAFGLIMLFFSWKKQV